MPTVPEKVVLHPLVLLSVVDHYNRVAKDTRKRVLGVLLGDTHKGQVDVTNSFAGDCWLGTGPTPTCSSRHCPINCFCCSVVPFEEDDQDPSIWFLDHSYMEQMFRMFKKVNGGWHVGQKPSLVSQQCLNQLPLSSLMLLCIIAAREKVMGWYHTGPRLREADLDINQLMANYCDNPVLVICEVEVRS